MEITEKYLNWRSGQRKSNNREEHLSLFVKDSKGQSEENQLKELELLYETINDKKSEYDQAGFHFNRFYRGVTLLEWGNLSVVEDLFVDRAWLLKNCGGHRFVKHFNRFFLEVLGGLLFLMTETPYTYLPTHDDILLKWYKDNRDELILDEEKGKFLIAQFEEKLNESK